MDERTGRQEHRRALITNAKYRRRIFKELHAIVEANYRPHAKVEEKRPNCVVVLVRSGKGFRMQYTIAVDVSRHEPIYLDIWRKPYDAERDEDFYALVDIPNLVRRIREELDLLLKPQK